MLPFTLPVMLPFMLPGLHKRKGGERVAPASKKTHPPLSRAGDWRRAAMQRAPFLAPAALVGLRRTLGGWGQRPQ